MNTEELQEMFDEILVRFEGIRELVSSYGFEAEPIISSTVALLSKDRGDVTVDLVYDVSCESPEELSVLYSHILKEVVDSMYDNPNLDDLLNDLPLN